MRGNQTHQLCPARQVADCACCAGAVSTRVRRNAHHHGVGVRAGGAAQDVVRRLHVGDPVPDRLAGRILQGEQQHRCVAIGCAVNMVALILASALALALALALAWALADGLRALPSFSAETRRTLRYCAFEESLPLLHLLI